MGGSAGSGDIGNKGVASGSVGSRSIKEPPECDFDFTVNVFGPLPDLVNQISEGDTLDIALDKDVVKVNLPDGRQLGSIDAGCSHLPRLVKCLQEGETYKAEIINKDGSQITIKVFPSE